MEGPGSNIAGMGGPGLPGGPEAWYRSLPPITRAVATATFVLTLLSNLGMLPVQLLMLDWELAIFKLQVWRFLSTILYIGRFSLGWVFHMYMWAQISCDLESNTVFTRASQGAYLLFILITTLLSSLLSLLVFWPSGLYFHGEAVLFACLYYWSRREAYTPVSVSFLTVQGYQLPFFLMLLHLLMGRDLWLDAFGLVAGHAYYFCREILPANGGPDFLTQAPKLLDMAAACVSNSAPAGGGPPADPGAPRLRPTGPPPAQGLRYRFNAGSSSSTQPFTGRGYTLGSDTQRT